MEKEKKKIKEVEESLVDAFGPLSAEQIFIELEKARKQYDMGNYKDFDVVLDEIAAKYNLK